MGVDPVTNIRRYLSFLHKSPNPFDDCSQSVHLMFNTRLAVRDAAFLNASVTGKQVVVTGGDGDLAIAISREFRMAGYEVDAPSRDRLDVRDPQTIRRYFHERNIDLLVCCAGVTQDALLIRMREADWDLVWETNYLGAKLCAVEALPAMAERRSGHIVFLSSHSALHPPFGQSSYAAAKRALIGLSRDLALRHGPRNIRVNALLPGFLDTRMTSTLPPGRKREVLAEHALGRLNTMSHASAFLRFLHESLPHTSGQWFQLDSRESSL